MEISASLRKRAEQATEFTEIQHNFAIEPQTLCTWRKAHYLFSHGTPSHSLRSETIVAPNAPPHVRTVRGRWPVYARGKCATPCLCGYEWFSSIFSPRLRKRGDFWHPPHHSI